MNRSGTMRITADLKRRHVHAIARAEKACIAEVKWIATKRHASKKSICLCSACITWRRLLAARERVKKKR